MNMETSSQKRPASIDAEHQAPIGFESQSKKKKYGTSSSQSVTNDSPINGARITDWDEYEKWKEVRGDIEPTMNYVEITPEAVEELKKIKNIIGDYICQLCKIKYENAFALAMHKCPRVVHIEFRCPECDKTFNCPANLASHRRWHKPQSSTVSAEPSASSSSSSIAAAPRKSLTNKQIRCSSRSDSRSTNTSTSTVSDTMLEYSSTATTTLDLSKKESMIANGIQHKNPDDIIRTMYHGNAPRIVPSLYQSLPNSFLKHPPMFSDHRPLPLPIPATFDLRRLQSSCIFCHEQFSELNHLLQHIRKNHAVSSSANTNSRPITLDKIVF